MKSIRYFHANSIRSLSNHIASAKQAQNHYKFIIAGGGCAGTSLLQKLSRKFDPSTLAVIEPSETHYYQAGYTLVGAGMTTLDQLARPSDSFFPANSVWVKDRVAKFDPSQSGLVLESGQRLTYDYLVISLGMTLRYDKIPGAIEALDKDPRVCSNYSLDYVDKTFKAYQAFLAGRAIFTLPMGAIKCAGAPQKVMYLFDDYLRKNNKRASAEIEYFTALPQMFSVDKYSNALAAICRQRGIKYHLLHHLVGVNHHNSEIIVEHTQTKERRNLKVSVPTIHMTLLLANDYHRDVVVFCDEKALLKATTMAT